MRRLLHRGAEGGGESRMARRGGVMWPSMMGVEMSWPHLIRGGREASRGESLYMPQFLYFVRLFYMIHLLQSKIQL